jgi:hypothetical protein
MVGETEHVVAVVALDLALPHRVVGPLNSAVVVLPFGDGR